MQNEETPWPGDDEAEAALARERKRDALDEAVSERADDAFDKDDQRKLTEEQLLGFALAWLEEDEGSPPIDIASGLANQACGVVSLMHELEEYGFDPAATSAKLTVNVLTAPLINLALQILGTIHPHVRKEIVGILKTLSEIAPEPTDEEAVSFENALDQLHHEQAAQFLREFNGLSAHSVDEESERIVEVDRSRRESGLN